MPRNRIRNLIEFPHAAVLRSTAGIEDSEEPDWETGETPEDKDGKPTDDWNFGGLTKHRTLAAAFDTEESLQFYHDSKKMSGHDVLQKWAAKFTS
ncbi:hypothetical protein PG984_014094 [Apiospora sp. TS-2023a]